MDAIQRLSEYFLRFPGIGPRQARRFAYFLMRQEREWVMGLIAQLSQVENKSRVCAWCNRHFIEEGNDAHCMVCRNENRDPSILLIVEKEVDFESIEKSRSYKGYYFILGGTLSLLEKEPAIAALSKLTARIRGEPHGGSPRMRLTEIILALSATTEGDDTVSYLYEHLEPLSLEYFFTLTTLGRGLSTGSEIEYADSKTLKDALLRRTKVD